MHLEMEADTLQDFFMRAGDVCRITSESVDGGGARAADAAAVLYRRWSSAHREAL